MTTSSLHPVPLEVPGDARQAALEADLSRREAELLALKLELQEVQRHYLSQIGALYAELSELEAAVAEAEVRAGLRPPPIDDDADEPPAAGHLTSGSCTNRTQPTDELKKVFRDVAKSLHPDLALDEPARCRRHSLMAEANRAYAERDADRLRLILRAWERSPEAIVDGEPDAPRRRAARRIAELEERLAAVDAEWADLRRSAIYQLKTRIERTRAEGWDLFAEMVLQVKSDIARARARLARVRPSSTGLHA
jgi:hypothetical protein